MKRIKMIKGDILVFAREPRGNARCYADQHLEVKMLEYLDILMDGYHYSNMKNEDRRKAIQENILTEVWMDLPTKCMIWSRTSIANWNQLLSLSQHLHKEYIARNKKESPEFRRKLTNLHKMITEFGKPALPNKPFSKYEICIPEEYRIKRCPSSNYISYYNSLIREGYELTWNNTQKPAWIMHTMQVIKKG